uniref:Uncharacterized protein n=1 Tax=Eptatretus burgeri TaxID=7764 RepID=A0A8C4QQJ2_EPTBU
MCKGDYSSDGVATVPLESVPQNLVSLTLDSLKYMLGHDCCPLLFSVDDRGVLSFVAKLDMPKQTTQRNMSAMERFHNMDKRALSVHQDTALETLHQNSITQLSIYEAGKDRCRKFCSTGMDGALAFYVAPFIYFLFFPLPLYTLRS